VVARGERPAHAVAPTAARSAQPRPAERSAFVFVGFMGAGKTTAARTVAAALGERWVDTDREIERELGESIASFFDREGEAAFRAVEERVVLRTLADPAARVIALGGGAVTSERVREELARHTVVYIEVDPAEAWRRASGGTRPLARDRHRFEQLERERRPLYESVADAIFPAYCRRESLRRALTALEKLAAAPRGTRMVWAEAASGYHPVFFARGLVASGFFYPVDGRRFLVADTALVEHHRPPAAAATVAVSGGEESKTLAQAEQVLRELARTGCERGDIVVAFGGGVVGDLAGFCAAVYQRGTRWVGIPSTLVAQVDSAYGGKTGVDLPEGKNYVGAYHLPAAVICDPDLLATLPAPELAAGYAEVVKTALIAGGRLWARVRSGADPSDDEVILGCLRTKLAVVAADERDAGRRQVLNLGHTVGHAIEAATGYRRYRHGEAVAVGLLCALRLSGRDHLRREVADLLAARGLPTTYSGAAPEQVLELVRRDKKRRQGRVPFVLVEEPGRVTPGHELSDDEMLAAIKEVYRP
jgi:shikimate kinase/3-dehydroquinate synthase